MVVVVCVFGGRAKRCDATIKAVAFSLGGGTIATGFASGELKTWQASGDLAQRAEFKGHTAAVVALDFTKGGSKLASASWDCTVRLWDAATGTVLHVMQGHEKPCTSVRIDPGGNWLVSGSMDESVRVWATSTGELVDFFVESLLHPATTVALASDGTRLAEASVDFTVRIWALDETGSRAQLVLAQIDREAEKKAQAEFDMRPSQRERRRSLTYRQELRASFLGTESPRDSVREPTPLPNIPDLGESSSLMTIKGHTATVSALAFHPTSPRILCSVSHDGTARFHDLDQGGALTSQWASKCGQAIWSCSFSADGSFLAIGTGEGIVELWNGRPRSENGHTLLYSFQAHTSFVYSCAFSGDGLRLATSGNDCEVTIWQIKPSDCFRGKQPGTYRRSVADEEKSSTTAESLPFPHDALSGHSLQEPVSTGPYPPGNQVTQAIQQLIDEREQELAGEQNMIRALLIAIRERQDEIKQLDSDASSLAAKVKRREELGLPTWGLATDDATYLERIRSRKTTLYQRVGRRTPDGNTSAYIGVPELQPGDLGRLARFEELLATGREGRAELVSDLSVTAKYEAKP